MTPQHRHAIAIIGGGLMGAGIAQVFATAGFRVKLFEPVIEVRATVRKRARANLQSVDGPIEAADSIELVDSVAAAVRDATFVIEAGPEKLDVKRAIFSDIVASAPRDCILASNTSVIPITRIAEGLPTAERIIGTHWWNPPYLIPLVEVVRARETAIEVADTTIALLTSVDKVPARIEKDTPGFVANRLQHALWREAIAMVAEGVCDAETLDTCVKNSFGMRLAVLGPLENADLVGLDLTLDIHRTIIPELDRSAGPNPFLKRQVEEGRLGFKSGEGFRRWTPDTMLQVRTRLARHLAQARSEKEPA